MLSGHDEALVAGLRAGTSSTRAAADDPDAVARALLDAVGAELVDVAELDAVLDAASLVADRPTVVDAGPAEAAQDRLAELARRVREAELVVARAVSFERARAAVRSGAPPADVVAASPTVRAAEAHLRRQQAAWKVAWWERRQPVPDPATWASRVRTLVCVDRDGVVDEAAYATMTAELPAVIRVVVLEPRRA